MGEIFIVYIILAIVLGLILWQGIQSLKNTKKKKKDTSHSPVPKSDLLEIYRKQFNSLMYHLTNNPKIPDKILIKALKVQETGTNMFSVLKSCPDLFSDNKALIAETIKSIKNIQNKINNFGIGDKWPNSIIQSVCSSYDSILKILLNIHDKAIISIKESVDMEKKVIDSFVNK